MLRARVSIEKECDYGLELLKRGAVRKHWGNETWLIFFCRLALLTASILQHKEIAHSLAQRFNLTPEAVYLPTYWELRRRRWVPSVNELSFYWGTMPKSEAHSQFSPAWIECVVTLKTTFKSGWDTAEQDGSYRDVWTSVITFSPNWLVPVSQTLMKRQMISSAAVEMLSIPSIPLACWFESSHALLLVCQSFTVAH